MSIPRRSPIGVRPGWTSAWHPAPACLFPILLLTGLTSFAALAKEPGRSGRQFMGIVDFSGFSRTVTAQGTVVLVSPEITTEFTWKDLVVSWNVRLATGTSLRVEAQARYPDRVTRFYGLGVWSLNGSTEPRRSLTGQQDSDGDVQTDILSLAQPADRARVRLTLEGIVTSEPTTLAFLGLSFLDPRLEPTPERMPRPTGADPLPVPERSQLGYDGGQTWCSPTALSMILGYWANRCERRDLDRDVPEVAAAVFDPGWPGTGNWSFNTAYAGSFPGMRGYVTRLASLDEVEAWLRCGVPLAASVSYSLLQGQPQAGNGHLVVCVGLTETGDVIVNDPGTRNEVRRVFPRADFLRAWAQSHHTVYVIHPVGWLAPEDPAGHWP